MSSYSTESMADQTSPELSSAVDYDYDAFFQRTAEEYLIQLGCVQEELGGINGENTWYNLQSYQAPLDGPQTTHTSLSATTTVCNDQLVSNGGPTNVPPLAFTSPDFCDYETLLPHHKVGIVERSTSLLRTIRHAVIPKSTPYTQVSATESRVPTITFKSRTSCPDDRRFLPSCSDVMRRTNHPLLKRYFRYLEQSKERDLLIQVVYSRWLASNEPEPQYMGKSILVGFLHRPRSDSPLCCRFDDCDRTFDRQDRAVAHIRQQHLGCKPFACEGSCGKGDCQDRFATPAYLRSHVKKIKARCDDCGREFARKNLSRHKRACGK